MNNMLLCDSCRWRGKQEDCIKTYVGVAGTGGDVEPVLHCPKCNSENLIELTDEGARLEPVPA